MDLVLCVAFNGELETYALKFHKNSNKLENYSKYAERNRNHGACGSLLSPSRGT